MAHAFLAAALLLVWCLACLASQVTFEDLHPAYDFIVVGGGTAGNVIASRLTENPFVQVLVIEAGPTNDGAMNVEIPLLPATLVNTPFDWNYTTTPQPGLNGRVLPYYRGHILGGTSSTNGMMYTRGPSEDYDLLARVTGDSGWSWNDLQPYIRKNERWTQPVDGHSTVGQFDPVFHSDAGMNPVALPAFPMKIDELVVQTTKDNPASYPFNLDMNSGNHLGIGWGTYTIDGGRRSSSATSYLGPTLRGRRNLHILTQTLVTRLLSTTSSLDARPVVRTVEFVTGDSTTRFTVNARKEIILSAGSLGTPNILLHSGIGNRTSLSALGLNTIVHLPSVGQNLSDHVLTTSVTWRVNSSDTLDSFQQNPASFVEALTEWQQTRTGRLAGTGINMAGFFRLPNDSSIFKDYPDPAAGPNTAHYEFIFVDSSSVTPPPKEGNYMSIMTMALTPLARGSVSINSNNPLDKPAVNPNLAGHPFEMFVIRRAIRSAVHFVSSPAWKDYIIAPAGPFAEVDIDDDVALDAFIRANSTPGYHAVATCAMSPEGASYGVTDPDLKVKRVVGLRVVDASVFPFLPSGHTQGPVYIIAERAADLIKGEWGLFI